MLSYLFLFGTIIFTVIGQLLTKYALPMFGPKPTTISAAFPFFFKVLTNLYFLGALLLAFAAALCWVMALQKFQLSYAYPFMSLSYVLVFLGANMLFYEQISPSRWIGLFTICLGVFLVSRS